MSTQGNKLKAIADAIRSMDGTTEPIIANTFPDRIRAIRTGGDVQVETMTITSMPTKMTYNIGETFDPTGISVTVKLNNGYTFVANEAHLSYGIEGAFTSAGTQTVPVRFSWGSEITETPVSVTVNRITLTVPVQSGTLTYTGNELTPTWSGYDSNKMSISGMTTATNAGSYVATFTLIGDNYQWTDGSTGPRNVSWSISKANSTMSLNVYSVLLDKEHLSTTVEVTKTGTSGAITAVSNNTEIATVSVSGNTITITSVNEKTGNVEVTVGATADANYNAPDGKTIAVTAKFVSIYGVSWDGTSTTKWTRTDTSADFADPVPYVAGASEYGSPFDNLMPWSGMTISERTGGTMVAIPKFWYKLEQTSNNGLKIQISSEPVSGFSVSPAHIDRGDGKGERSIVYVARYFCNTAYKSTTGTLHANDISLTTANTNIHNIGATTYQIDFSTVFTIWLLYLVEFADWDSQTTIGYGGRSSSDGYGDKILSGYTDTMPYHTGTMLASKTEYGASTQYRNIEGLWDNMYWWIAGYNVSSAGQLSISINPTNNFATTDGVAIDSINNDGYPSKFKVTDVAGFAMFYPVEYNGSDTTYSCDSWDQKYQRMNMGYTTGLTSYSKTGGLFYINSVNMNSLETQNSCRSMELPNGT